MHGTPARHYTNLRKTVALTGSGKGKRTLLTFPEYMLLREQWPMGRTKGFHGITQKDKTKPLSLDNLVIRECGERSLEVRTREREERRCT